MGCSMSTNARMGATLEQVSERGDEIRHLLFELQSLLKVCGSTLSLDNQDDGADADDVGVALKIAAKKLDESIERIELLTWTDDEIKRCELARANSFQPEEGQS
jgi:cob(I)alamin adenosyltransferase